MYDLLELRHSLVGIRKTGSVSQTVGPVGLDSDLVRIRKPADGVAVTTYFVFAGTKRESHLTSLADISR